MDAKFSRESTAYSHFIRNVFPPPSDFSISGIRERAEAVHAKVNENLIGKFQGSTEERKIRIKENTGRDSSDRSTSLEIPVTIYTPKILTKKNLIIFFHGGGWVVNSRKTHQTIVNMAADATKSIWISVEYRLAPEHKFPIWLDDAREVTRYILAHKTEFGGEETTKVGVAGDSAGGLISASLSHTVKNLDFQILICSQLEFVENSESRMQFNHPDFILTKDVLSWFESNAFRNDDDKLNPNIALLRKPIDKSLPRCLLIAAELDLLRDDSYKYQVLLQQAGVETKLVLIKGALHLFFSNPGIYLNSCQQAIDAIEKFLN